MGGWGEEERVWEGRVRRRVCETMVRVCGMMVCCVRGRERGSVCGVEKDRTLLQCE